MGYDNRASGSPAGWYIPDFCDKNIKSNFTDHFRCMDYRCQYTVSVNEK